MEHEKKMRTKILKKILKAKFLRIKKKSITRIRTKLDTKIKSN